MARHERNVIWNVKDVLDVITTMINSFTEKAIDALLTERAWVRAVWGN